MKRTLCLFLALILAVGICFSAPVTITASAAEAVTSGNCGASTNTGGKSSVTWAYDSATTTLTISGSGAMANFYKDSAPWYENHRKNIKTIVIEKGVTSIGKYSFYYCSALTSVTIPESVTIICEYAFSNCTSLTTVTIPESVTRIATKPFYNCTKLTTVNVPCNWDGSIYEFAENKLKIADHDTTKTATCISKAECSVCGKYGEFAPHTYENGKCTVEGCGYACAHKTKDKNGICTVCCIAEGTCGASTNDGGESSVEWLYDSVSKTLTITGTGAMADYGLNNIPWGNYKSSITQINIENGVTTIAEFAFANCISLTSVTIPDSVTTIGRSAFTTCTALTSVMIPESVTSIGDYAFECCTSLTSVTIPGSVTTIGDGAFSGCTSLTSVEIPDSVTTIGDWAFSSCTELTEIKVAEGNTNYSSEDGVLFNANKTELICYPAGKKGNYEIPTTVTEIAPGAFSGNTLLESVIIPYSVTSIGTGAFSNCTFLTTVNAPCSWNGNPLYTFEDGVKVVIPKHTIENNACTTCEGSKCGATASDTVAWVYDEGTLYINGKGAMADFTDTTMPWYSYRGKIKTIVINKGVTSIGKYSFYNCTALTSVTIPESVTSIGYGAFGACKALPSVTIPEGVKTIGNNAFSNCMSLVSVTIPDSITTIGDYAFSGCESLTTVTIGDSVTTIGNYAFSGCTNLTSVTIPKNVTTIGRCAFAGCAALTSINVVDAHTKYSSVDGVLFNADKTELICYPAGRFETSYTVPESVTTIGEAAFRNCTKLTSVTIGDRVTTIGWQTFCDCTALTSVTIGKGVTEIEGFAFDGCSELTSVTIPESVTSIGNYAFHNCQKLILTVEPGSYAHNYAKTNSIPYIFNGYNEAETAQIEKLTFTEILNDNEVIAYSVTGCDKEISGELKIPATYNGKPVTEIGIHAFSSCISLETVTIGNSVTSIGDYAFSACTALATVTIPDSVTTIGNYTFNACTALATVTIPGSETTIGKDAFNGCTNILLFVDKDNTDVQDYATDNNINYVFDGSGELEKLTFTINEDGESYSVTGCDTTILGALTIPSEFNGKRVTEIGNNAFAYCDTLSSVTIPESVTTIGDSAFSECTGLTSVTIPSSAKTIGYHAFSKCTGLQTVTIGENVTTIGDGAFADCSSLSSVIIPNSVTTIGKNAFDSCTNLESVTIGNAVEKIDVGTFSNCTSLETIKIPDSVQIIGDYAFDSCESLKSVTIGEKTETIGGYAFRDCSLLGEIKIPDSVKTIGNYAFDNCISLGTAIIGNEVKTIGDSAFGNCVNLKSLTIGKAVETIGELAFQQCPLLTEIVIPASVIEIGENALIGCSGLKYIFFEGTEEAQKDVADSIGIATNVHYGSSTHTFEENYTVDVEPTCTKKGRESQHCKYCEETQDPRDVKELGHTSVKGGKIDVHTKCDVCGVTLSAEHEFTKTVIKAPTCTSQGVETWACECGYSETNNVEESDHNFVNHDGKVATCTEDGYYPYQTCTTCDYTTYHVDPAKGHDIVIDKAVEATCTKTGLTEGSHCTRCNDKTVKQNVIPTKAHTEVTVTGKAATCTATGLTDGKKCSVCGAVTVEQQVISATGHTITVVGKKDATTKDAGYTGDKVCSVCNAEIEKGKEIPKIIVSLATPTVTIKNTAKGIEVNWNAIENAESYIVYRSIYNASTKKWSKWGTIKTGVTDISFVDGTVKLGTSYKYTVRAVNGDVKSNYVGSSSLKYNVVPTVKIANTATGVKVSWSTAANATGYRVYRSQYNTKTKKWSGWKNMGTAKANKTAWVDKSVASGTYYKYTVRAVNGKILSSYKASASLMFLSQPTVKFVNASTGVKVAWSKVKGATGYTVYRSELVDGKWSKWSNRGTAKADKSSWVDKKVTSGVTYKYTVRAVNGKVMSSFVETKGLLYLAQPTVTVKAVSNGINVAWSQCEGATGYTVYRSEYNTKTKKWSKWSNRGTAKAEKSNWTDKKATKGVTYKYTVRAVNADTGAKSSYIASKNVKR